VDDIDSHLVTCSANTDALYCFLSLMWGLSLWGEGCSGGDRG